MCDRSKEEIRARMLCYFYLKGQSKHYRSMKDMELEIEHRYKRYLISASKTLIILGEHD